MAAVITPGYTYATNGEVTAVNLGQLVSQATITGIDQSNLASGFGLVITSSTQPSNTNAIWIDSSTGNTPKYYTGSVWTAIGTGTTTTGIGGVFRNLKSFWASNSTWTVTADEINVKDASNNDLRLTALSATLNSASSNGINALDTGTKANNTIYYIWVLAKADGTKGIIYSLATAFGSVTLPSGYTYGALVSCLATNNSGNFIKATQTGRRYSFAVWATMASGTPGTTPWVAIDMTPANMTTNAGFVPSVLSDFCYGSVFGTSNEVYMTNDNSVTVGQADATNKLGIIIANPNFSFWQFDIITADTLYWTANGSTCKVYLHGFELNKIV